MKETYIVIENDGDLVFAEGSNIELGQYFYKGDGDDGLYNIKFELMDSNGFLELTYNTINDSINIVDFILRDKSILVTDRENIEDDKQYAVVKICIFPHPQYSELNVMVSIFLFNRNGYKVKKYLELIEE